MGKKQHQKDKLYLTCTEWSTLYGGKRATEDKRRFKRLPFHCCSITFQPFKTPYCTKEGIIFDLECVHFAIHLIFFRRNVLPFVRKHGLNPVTGKKMKAGELIKLNFHRNSDGKYHCPVTFKVFNENTHIVAVKVTGNVYSHEAVTRLNVKSNNYFDLLTSEPFTKDDIITIQDPANLDKFNISAFYHVQNKEENQSGSNVVVIRQLNQETKETLAELPKDLKVPDYMLSNKPISKDEPKKRDAFNTAVYSTGKAAASLTSTVMEPVTKVEPAILEDDVVRYKYVKKKGYVSLVTTHGRLNLELHCDLVPKTCENFIRHCESGYYKETTFHRLIRYFIVNHVSPHSPILLYEFRSKAETLVALGSVVSRYGENRLPTNFFRTSAMMQGESCPWLIRDQIQTSLSSSSRLGNANIWIKSIPFSGNKVVGGMETLNKFEFLETDKDDRPLEEIQILNCEVFVDPFKEVEEMLSKERMQASQSEPTNPSLSRPKPGNRREEEALEAEERARRSRTINSSTVYRDGVGKFIDIGSQIAENTPVLKRHSATAGIDSTLGMNTEVAHKKQKTVLRSTLSDFSVW
ncbi:Peptidyl-prolyl cis-trans isomerase [Paragonimus heterotremus]|uniref:Peptidyl-prolyl cis-trans isomerase n=1 Tax=Paragonimus heterotremus TaxID=100268 RepID=A0A8J4WJ27_9TREM|nr:Peptidyl-prolyl cis-trans isomerase [Paragonimus heterotremus]